MSIFNKNMRWIFPLLSLLVLTGHVYLLTTYWGIELGNALTDGIITVAVLASLVWGMLLIVNSYPTRVGVTFYALILATFFSLGSGYISYQVLRLSLGKEDPQYLAWLTSTMPIRYVAHWLICGWVATYTALSKLSQSIEDKFKQQADAASLLREAELYKLRQQLQPHFLYNSLNSISALTMIEPEKAQEMIGRLSDFLRNSVKREAQEQIPIREELEYIEAYLAIESVRFGDRLKIIFERAYTDHALIPPFLLQPVLENAIKFGLYGKTGSVTITVYIALKDATLEIAISNPYDPQTQMPRGTGFGLEGIRRRLYLLYGRTDLLETQKNDELFTTILKIPQHV